MKMALGKIAAAITVPALCFGSVVYAESPSNDPSALLRRLYMPAQPRHLPLWWGYLTGRAQSTFLQVQRVQQQTGNELIEEDFLCQCQDNIGLHVISLSLSHQTPTSISARVRFGFADQGPQTVQIDLMKTRLGWRISQMTNAQGQTFTAENEAALGQ
jgi:hypothetical protein